MAMRARWTDVRCVIAVGVLAGPAGAEGASASTAAASPSITGSWQPVWTVRVGLPLGGVLFRGRSGLVQLFGVSASARFVNVIEAEIAANLWQGGCHFGPSVTPRVGVSPGLLKTAVWDVRAPVLASYSYGTLDGSGCEYEPDQKFHLATASLGLDATYELFNMRLLPFAGVAWNEVHDWYGGTPTTTTRAFAYGVMFQVGVRVPGE